MGWRGGPKPFRFHRKIIKLELRSGFDLRGAGKLNKNKRLPWGQSVPLINQLNSASAVLQWVSSSFGTWHRSWKLPNTTWRLPAAKPPLDGQGWYIKWRCLGSR